MKLMHWRSVVAAVLVLCLPSISTAEPSPPVQDLINEFGGIRNDKTPLGVTDGNPLAATAVMARSAYEHFGLQPRISSTPWSEDDDWVFDVTAGGGAFTTGGFDGFYTTLDVELGHRFSDRFGATILIPLEYRDTERTGTYIGGIELGLPFVVKQDKGDGLSWVLTPSAMAASAALSIQLAQGGYMAGGGLTSSLAWRSGNLTLVMANQATYAVGRPLGYDEAYAIRQNIDQTILKNGVKGMWDFNETFALDVSLTFTNLLTGAYIDDYWTPSLGLTWQCQPWLGIRAGLQSDLADDFTSYGGTLQVNFQY